MFSMSGYPMQMSLFIPHTWIKQHSFQQASWIQSGTLFRDLGSEMSKHRKAAEALRKKAERVSQLLSRCLVPQSHSWMEQSVPLLRKSRTDNQYSYVLSMFWLNPLFRNRRIKEDFPDQGSPITTTLSLRLLFINIGRPGQLCFSSSNMEYLNSMSRGYRKRVENFSYALDDQIGRGFSSTVFSGVNDATQQRVAIKVINLTHVKNSLAKSMLDNEVQCLRNFNHPNLLRLHASMSTVNNYYIVTQFCEGDMANRLRTQGRLTEAQLASVFRDVLSGYKMLYCYGYVHRDIKPANLLVKNGAIKIADFGFVRKSLNGQRRKQTHNIGTPLYMSPESMLCNVYSPKSDIWSMGVVLYQLLSGRVPWECRSQQQLKDQICKSNIDYKGLAASDSLLDLLSRCLQVDQSRRISIQQLQKHQWVTVVAPQKTLANQPKGSTLAKDRQITHNSLHVLRSYLNFARFIHKIHSRVSKSDLDAHLSSALQNQLSTSLVFTLDFHKRVLETKLNLVNCSDWLQFVQSPNWHLYVSVVNSYLAKYSQVTRNKVGLGSNRQPILQIIKQLLTTSNLPKQTAVLLDQLVSYYQLVQLLDRIDYDYSEFNRLSQIDRIMEGQPDPQVTSSVIVQNVRCKLYRMGVLN